MRVAEETAALSYANRLQVGCIIVKDNRILSIGYNGTPAGWDNCCEDIITEYDDNLKCDKVSTKTKSIVIHAESNALTKLCQSHDSSNYILAAKSAGMFIRKDVFNEIGGFDESFFIYVEETDLGIRSWMHGYTAKYIPNSIVYHHFGTSTLILGKGKTNFISKFHGTKNYIQMHIKNLERNSLVKILPLHIVLWLGLALYMLLKLQYLSSFWVLKGIFWNIKNLKQTLQKREVIQNNRKVSDKDIFKLLLISMPFMYFLKKAMGKQKVGNAQSFSKLSSNVKK